LLGAPYKSINDQIAKDDWDNESKRKQIHVNSSINDTILSFKSSDKNTKTLDSETSLRSIELPTDDDLLINTTYNQILTLNHKQLATFEYIFIDESHILTNDITFRSDVIAGLIYHLIEFIVKNPDAKTKIIFMSGTPNVETLVIPKIMEDYGIENLFQKIVVKKQYAISPTIHLTHLDTNKNKKRSNAVMKQISEYLNQKRKVVIIFNNKEKMDQFHQEINTNLGKEIKVGLFYSGSTGECTQNILSGKFGDYDVVLATNYFINGININKDELTEDEIKVGKTSTQKYGVVIDLGNRLSHISTIDTIQAVNRFRNRLCDVTVFFPKIFKPDLDYPLRKFHYGNAAKVLLGINRYNFHLLSVNNNATPNQINEEEKVEVGKIHYVDKFRNNPLNVSLNDINAATMREENERKVKNMIQKEVRVYEDWYYSLDGYHYLAKDAGFNTIIEQKDFDEPLKEISESHIQLENKIIKTLVVDEKEIYNLINNFEKGTRINIQASNKVVEPSFTDVGNFSTINYMNNTYILEGDFHSSHESAINKLFRCYFKLSYYYDREKAIEIMKNLINSNIDFLSKSEKSYLKNITKYVRSCNLLRNEKCLKSLNYISALDHLAKRNLGIVKNVSSTWISYTVINTQIVKIIKRMWTKQQFEMLHYKLKQSVRKNDWSEMISNKNKIRSSQSQKKIWLNEYYGNTSNKKKYIPESMKKDFQKCYSNSALIEQHDLEELEIQLKQASDYTPLSYNGHGDLKKLETIIVPRIIQSSKLLLSLEIDKNEYSQPEQTSVMDIEFEMDQLISTIENKLDSYAPIIIRRNNPYLDLAYGYLMNRLKNRDIFGLIEYANNLISDPKSKFKPGLLPVLTKIQEEFNKIDQIFLIAFKASEYSTYKNVIKLQTLPFKKDIFFCDEDFNFESLKEKSTFNLSKINKKDIYNSLRKKSKLFINTKSIRPRDKSGKRAGLKSNYTKKVYLVLDKNSKLLFADFSKTQACVFLCDYAYKNEGFKMKDGTTPVKIENKGIYNPDTFRKDYFSKKLINKTVNNYSPEVHDVNIQDYKDYIDSL
tara:strand:+ start:43176 stop:46340 length:3165 start_codon:yes stop_codon:yes gene_type:complete